MTPSSGILDIDGLKLRYTIEGNGNRHLLLVAQSIIHAPFPRIYAIICNSFL